MSRTTKLRNAFFNLLDNDRRCSKCRYFEAHMRFVDKVLIFQGIGRVSPDYDEYCTFSESRIANEESNCSNFKRKYGHSPFTKKLIDFNRWTKNQWSVHDKIIEFSVGTIIAVIGILITVLLAKGYL